MTRSLRFKYHIVLILVFCMSSMQAQSKRQAELEQRRQEILQEIQQINTLLIQGKQDQKSAITIVEDINYKIRVRQNLINITNQQANLLTREINQNQKTISEYRDKLKLLKEEYAAMIVKAYKSKSEESKVMFLLSSNNFQQAYKRLKYIKQYADYQKKQGEEIKRQTAKLQELNTNLLKQKEDKKKLIDENRKAKNALTKEMNEQETLVNAIKKNLSAYTKQVRTKQREADKIDKEIKKLIREAMASSNTKAGKSASSNTFSLTPEDRALANSFNANKGKLPWPVEEGIVKMNYGTHPSPIDRSVTIKSNGVRIATNKGEIVRAVFEGTVNSIIVPKNGNLTIMIQHGNYFTVYKNLSKIYVKKGDKVSTKQNIGEVLTSKSSGETILSFLVFKGLETQNPAHWVYKM